MSSLLKFDETRLSVVVPVYRGRAFVRDLVKRVQASVQETGLSPDLILVDDQCPDESWAEIKAVCAEHDWIQGLRLSRNFGQHNAITAGMAHACGEWVVVMDCDLQDRPEEIPNLFQKAQEGFHLVRACRKVRQDRWLKRQSSILFNRLFYLIF